MEQKASVLVVDDELGPRESLRMILKPLYDVHTAANGQEALDCIQKEKVDLITLDIKMPGLSGMDVLRELRKLGSDAAVVIVTGYGTLTNVHDAIRYGAVDFVSKPFNVPDIVAIVNKSVAQRSYNRKVKNIVQKIRSIHAWEDNEIDEFLNN
ncbi:MAG: response regulator [Deltaproteobacteria bacterium]|jgi:DNA-binding NtrC family response regulator|nr:response regulator [Deltaproteobacteria bacterium]MDO9210471.1 response regulator [Deltaproteobacteria bacterium]